MNRKQSKSTNTTQIQNEIDSLTQKINQMKKDLKGKEKSDYRKKRARRLIQTGALVEKYFGIENLSIKEREELFIMFSAFVKSNMPNRLKK